MEFVDINGGRACFCCMKVVGKAQRRELKLRAVPRIRVVAFRREPFYLHP